MYNYDGLVDIAIECFIYGTFSFLVFNPFTKKNREQKKYFAGIGFFILFTIFGFVHLSCINSSDINTFTGRYVSTKGKDGSFVCETYYFQNEEKQRAIEITKNSYGDLIDGYLDRETVYTVYYVTVPASGNVCVRIEEMESP